MKSLFCTKAENDTVARATTDDHCVEKHFPESTTDGYME